jgi:hypothetical protein
MAQIEYLIDLKNGIVTITPTIRRLDPGDEIHLITTTPNAALQWNNESPFLTPAAESVLVLRQTSSPAQVLNPAKPIDLSEALGQCGETDDAGKFTAWVNGAGFPIGTGTNRPTGN